MARLRPVLMTALVASRFRTMAIATGTGAEAATTGNSRYRWILSSTLLTLLVLPALSGVHTPWRRARQTAGSCPVGLKPTN
jgi:Cu/Ag efflux pump CusA